MSIGFDRDHEESRKQGMNTAGAHGAEKRGRGIDRREQILQVALQLFAQHGMAQVSTRQIARAVGISQPSLYAHFASAHEISAELCLRAFAGLSAASRKVLEAPGTPRDRFYRLGRAYIDFGLAHPDMYRLAFMQEPDETVSQLVQQGKDPVMAAGQGAFDLARQALAQMLGRTEAEVELQAQSIWASVHGLTALLIARPMFPWVDRERLIEHHLAAICAPYETAAAPG